MSSQVSLPQGFQTAGMSCGIKQNGRPDLALFVSSIPASAAGVFTKNRVCGAPVIVSRSRVPTSSGRAIVINSGNANAATGKQGLRDAEQMTSAVAATLGCRTEDVLVCSTGVIGVQLPMPLLQQGIPSVVAALGDSPRHLEEAAAAMMTTDTFHKISSREITVNRSRITVTGAAKGAAMIAPNMATMLGVIMTDARLTPEQAHRVLQHGVDRSFNCITVDGHMSTSDTVLLLANGAAGIPTSEPLEQEVTEAVRQVCEDLATSIIRDAEGADHFITVDVAGFADREQAERIAREICESALVKTAVTGADPNWGRIVSAAGYANVPFEAEQLSLRINGVQVYRAGTPEDFDEADLSRQMREQRDVHFELMLEGGPCFGSASARFWTSDLTAEYVRLNSDYTT